MSETREAGLTMPAFRSAYRDALARHLNAPGEATLRDAYELGRRATDVGVSVLDVAAAHHEALRETLASAGPDAADEMLEAAADFLAEALSAAEMVRRGYIEVREAERREREHAAVVRRLTTLLADTSLAAYGRDAIAEMLQLVAEHARELADADACAVRVDARGRRGTVEAVSAEDGPARRRGPADREIELTSLDGSRLGTMALWGSGFSELSEALARHIAQLASAALDRADLHAGLR